ncbi:hypothetical protein Tco_1343507 [Tanacetum coccineum]
MGNAIVKLVKKVKKLEGFLKRRNLVLTDSEDEEPEVQGRKSQADPQDSSNNDVYTSNNKGICFWGGTRWRNKAQNTLRSSSKLSRRLPLKVQGQFEQRKEVQEKKRANRQDSIPQAWTFKKINWCQKSYAAIIELILLAKEKESTYAQLTSFAPISVNKPHRKLEKILVKSFITKTPKKTQEEDKDDEAKDDEPTKSSQMRRKQIAKKVWMGLRIRLEKRIMEMFKNKCLKNPLSKIQYGVNRKQQKIENIPLPAEGTVKQVLKMKLLNGKID